MAINSLLSKIPKMGTMGQENFFQVAVDHFPYILKKGYYKVRDIEPVYAEIYKGDFHGLLLWLSIDYSLLHIVTAFNGLQCSLDYDGQKTRLLIPDQEFITKINAIFRVKM